MRESCGECLPCLDMPKFGGDGVRRQKCEKRVCKKGQQQQQHQQQHGAFSVSTNKDYDSSSAASSRSSSRLNSPPMPRFSGRKKEMDGDNDDTKPLL